MKKNRIKKIVASVPRSEDELRQCVSATVDAQIECEGLIAKRDAAMKAAAEPFAARISELQTIQSRNLELLEAWAAMNRDRFDGDKSVLVEGHRLGWRTGNYRAALAEGTRTWADVIAHIKAHGREFVKRFLRVKEDVNKEAIIAARNEPATLKAIGAEAVQDESFYLSPAREGQQPALMTA